LLFVLAAGAAFGLVGWIWTLRKSVETRCLAAVALHNAQGELETKIEARTRDLRKEITERKFVEQSLKTPIFNAETANRTKSEFLANMSHELRSPLTAVIGYSEAMGSEIFGKLENPKYAEYIQHINVSGHHLLDLINDILDVSAIEAGQITLNQANLDLNDLSESALRMVVPRAEKRGVKLQSKISESTIRINADERKVKQILVNLLTNAVKFTPRDGKVILDGNMTENGSLNLNVSDSGVGMDEKGIEVALSKFGQIDRVGNSDQEGTGLGLPLTVGLVEAHGGTLHIKSELNVGTTVTVLLPPERVVH